MAGDRKKEYLGTACGYRTSAGVTLGDWCGLQQFRHLSNKWWTTNCDAGHIGSPTNLGLPTPWFAAPIRWWWVSETL